MSYNSYGYPNQHYPPPQQQSYRRQPDFPPRTKIYGLVIGLDKSRTGYLMYSKCIGKLITIDRSVEGLVIGAWLTVDVFVENYRGDFILNYNNSEYYSTRMSVRDVSARFFPASHYDPYLGELLIAARFDVRANDFARCYEYVGYEIHINNLIDNYNLMNKSAPCYPGRSLIVEAQASLNGFIVVKVHEDPNMQLDCDNLPNTVAPYDCPMLDDTCLMTVMTGNGYGPRFEQYSENSHESLEENSYQHEESRSSSTRSPFEGPSSATYDDLRSSSEPELRAIASDSHDNTLIPSRSTIVDRTLVQSATPSPFEDDFEDDTEETKKTLGTQRLLRGKYFRELGQQTLDRCKMEKVLRNEAQTVMCVVVLKMEKYTVLYAIKSLDQDVRTQDDTVLNVLVQDDCRGLNGPLNIGDVAVFDVSPRREVTIDKLLPRSYYSHIAVRMNPANESTDMQVALFKKSVRTFGGLLEMKVRINLREKNQVIHFYNEDTAISKSESERKLYFLKSQNGVTVSIPVDRLISYLSADFTAKFELVAWAVHRQSVHGVSLHIGERGKATCVYHDGEEPLPPLSDTRCLMNERKL